MQQLINNLRQLLASQPKDRHIKGHAMALLNKLQELNLQDND